MHYNNKGRSHSLLDRRSRLSLFLSLRLVAHLHLLGLAWVETRGARERTRTNTESRGRFFNGMVGDLP